MLKLVWDSSALVNIKEPNAQGYSPAHSLWKDLADGWISGPYQNIIPAIASFELSAAVSRKRREDVNMLYEFWLIGENEIIYPIDSNFLEKCSSLVQEEGFNTLRGADLIFACIAKIEVGILVTLDNHFDSVSDRIQVLNLNDSRENAEYSSDARLIGQGTQ